MSLHLALIDIHLRPASKDVSSPDVLPHPFTGSSSPDMLFTCLWLLPPQMCLRYAPVAPSPGVTTMGCHIQLRSLLPRDAPTSRCPPPIQCVLFAYRCVSHSLVADSQKCHQYSSVAPPPIYSYHPPHMCVPRPQMGFIALFTSQRPAAPPLLIQPLPARSRLPNPSQPRPPLPHPSPRSHPAVPLPSPRCAPFPPLPTHLPAPERRPPPTMPRAESWPGPCSRNAVRGPPPLFPPCLAQRLLSNLTLSPLVTSRTHSQTAHPERG